MPQSEDGLVPQIKLNLAEPQSAPQITITRKDSPDRSRSKDTPNSASQPTVGPTASHNIPPAPARFSIVTLTGTHIFGHETWNDITRKKVAIGALLSTPCGLLSDFFTIFNQSVSLYLFLIFSIISSICLIITRRYRCASACIGSLILAFMFGIVYSVNYLSGQPDNGAILALISKIQMELSGTHKDILNVGNGVNTNTLAIEEGNRLAIQNGAKLDFIIIQLSVLQPLITQSQGGDLASQRIVSLIQQGDIDSAARLASDVANDSENHYKEDKIKTITALSISAYLNVSINPDISRSTFTKILALNPQNADAMAGLTVLDLLSGNINNAFAQAKKVLPRLSADSPLRIMLVILSSDSDFLSGQIEEAVSAVKSSHDTIQPNVSIITTDNPLVILEMTALDATLCAFAPKYPNKLIDYCDEGEKYSYRMQQIPLLQSKAKEFLVGFALSKGNDLVSRQNIQDGLELYRQAENILNDLLLKSPDNILLESRNVSILDSEARAFMLLKDYINAEQTINLSISIGRKIVRQLPNSQLYMFSLADSLETAGKVEILKRDYEHASAYLSEALSIFSNSGDQNLGWALKLEIVSTSRYYAIALYHLSALSEADRITKAALPDADQVVRQHPEINDAVNEFAYLCNFRAEILRRLGRNKDANNLVESSNDLLDRLRQSN